MKYWRGLRIFFSDPLKCFLLKLKRKLKRKPLQKIRTKKPPELQTTREPLCNCFFPFGFLLLICFIFFNLLLISFGFLLFLIWFLSFSGTSHSFFLIFFFICFGFIFLVHLFFFFFLSLSLSLSLIWHESKLIYFPSSYFSSQPNKIVFHSSTFSSLQPNTYGEN